MATITKQARLRRLAEQYEPATRELLERGGGMDVEHYAERFLENRGVIALLTGPSARRYE